jgi:beta-N-acetylhexosaminidase
MHEQEDSNVNLIVQQTIPKKFEKFFYSLPILEQAGFFLWPSLSKGEMERKEKNLLNQIKPSGCILFKRNFQGFSQSRSLISSIRKSCARKNSPFRMPFIVSIDEEGGRVSRLPLPFPRGKPALEFSDNNDVIGLENQILHQIFTAKGLGINCLLSPVADILSEPTNPVIGDRCYGKDAATVTKFAGFVNKILLNEKMFSCAKHFPGHGNTTTDSHKELSINDVSLNQLKSREWLPFQKLIYDEVPFIITAHVIVPSLDKDNPATLSKNILIKYLRGYLGFKGLILSDDLRMNAIAEHYKSKRNVESSITEENFISTSEEDSYLTIACIDALKAGCDILLSCQSITREAKIAHAIAEKMQNDKIFHKQMLEKAWNIFLILTKKGQNKVL